MEEKFKYEFDEATGILYKYYYGPITIEDIYSSWDYAIEKNLIPKATKGFILDYRNGNLDISIKENYKIAEYYKAHLDIFGGLKIAIITQTVKDLTIPLLVELRDDGYVSKPFYTLEAAIKWVSQHNHI
jgi:hypothetical protein